MSAQIASIFKTLSYGVYIIAVSDGEQRNAFTAAWVMQVSFKPLLIAFSINPGHYSYRILQQGEMCTINVLAKNQMALADHFGQSGLDNKMAFCKWLETPAGVPYLAKALSYFECKVRHFYKAGDHEIVVCEVVDAQCLNEGLPMLYQDTGNMDGSIDVFPDGFI